MKLFPQSTSHCSLLGDDIEIETKHNSVGQQGLYILGVKTWEPHEWRKIINTKKPVRSQHNRAKDNNSKKTKKNFTGFTPTMTPNKVQILTKEEQ